METCAFYKCGCPKTITGSRARCAEEIAELKEEVCSACIHRERRALKHKKALEEAIVLNDGLPALMGSQKQIEWAEAIRAYQIPKLKELHDKVIAWTKNESYRENKGTLKAITVLSETISETDCRFWIDNRFTLFNQSWILGAKPKSSNPETE